MDSEPATQSTTSTTEQKLSKQQKELLELAMPQFRDIMQNPVAPYGGAAVAPFNPNQVQGQQMALGAAGQQAGTAAAATGGQQFLASGDVLRPENNPALRQHAEAAVQPIYQNLQEVVLPSVRSSAYGTGGFGGSRQGIAEGLAAGRAAQAAGATTADIYNRAYGQGLDAMGKGIALTPTVQGAQVAPAATTSAVGDVQQGREQALLNQQISDYYMRELFPYTTAKELAALASGIPGGSTVTQGTSTAQASSGNPLSQILGGISTGASLLPFFMSDRRLKRNIEVIGKLFDGQKVYRYQFEGVDGYQIGLMADEAPEHARVQVNEGGYLALDYKKATEVAAEIGRKEGDGAV